MKKNDELEIDINEEIRMKRFNPDFLCGLFEEKLESITKKHEADFTEYKISKEKWEKNIQKPVQCLNNTISEMQKLIELADEIENDANQGIINSAHKIEFNNRIANLKNQEYDFEGWSKKDFAEMDRLMFERGKLLVKNEVISKILSTLLKHSSLDILSDIIVFGISFLLPFGIEHLIERQINILDSIYTKLILGILLYIMFDKLAENVKVYLKWKRVESLYNDLQLTLNNIEKAQSYIKSIKAVWK